MEEQGDLGASVIDQRPAKKQQAQFFKPPQQSFGGGPLQSKNQATTSTYREN